MTITRYAFTTRMGVGAFQYEALPVVVPDGPYVLHTDHLADKAEAVRGLRKYAMHLPQCDQMGMFPMVSGQQYSSTDYMAWRAAQACTCGLDAALAEHVELTK